MYIFYVYVKAFHLHNKYLECNCGVETFSAGGDRIRDQDYPWMVQVFSSTGACGGSLVASRYVVTAAHCVVAENGTQDEAKNILIKIAQTFSPTPEFVAVSKVMVNEYYQYSSYLEQQGFVIDSDIALLELDEELDLNIHTPICLAKTEDNGTYHEEKDAGDGEVLVYTKDQPYMNRVEKINVITQPSVISLAYLHGIFGRTFRRNLIRTCRTKICTWPRSKNIKKVSSLRQTQNWWTTCIHNIFQGDSGGPLMYKDKISEQYVLVGVVNSVHTVAPPYEDLVKLGQTQQFEDISFHRKWIEMKMTNPKFCALGPDVGNKVEARRCPFQLFISMCRMLEEFSTNTISMISDSFSIPVPLLLAAYVLLCLISVNSMYNDVKTSLGKIKNDKSI